MAVLPLDLGGVEPVVVIPDPAGEVKERVPFAFWAQQGSRDAVTPGLAHPIIILLGSFGHEDKGDFRAT
jgi:hypothetical protein